MSTIQVDHDGQLMVVLFLSFLQVVIFSSGFYFTSLKRAAKVFMLYFNSFDSQKKSLYHLILNHTKVHLQVN